MDHFTIEIASVPGREKLVAEIWYKNTMIAEINQELSFLEIELFQTGKLNFTFED